MNPSKIVGKTFSGNELRVFELPHHHLGHHLVWIDTIKIGIAKSISMGLWKSPFGNKYTSVFEKSHGRPH